MPIPTMTQEQVMELYALINSTARANAETNRSNLDAVVQNIRAFADLPTGAEGALQAVRSGMVALTKAAQMAHLFGNQSMVDMQRKNVIQAVDGLAQILVDATPNARASNLGTGLE